MQALELTTEQQDKLLEMCTVLFPESKPKMYENEVIGLWVLNQESSTESEYLVVFHWFEFCVTKIFPKLNQWYNAHQLADFLYQTIGCDRKYEPNEKNKFPHPIDYLYEQFKTISK